MKLTLDDEGQKGRDLAWCSPGQGAETLVACAPGHHSYAACLDPLCDQSIGDNAQSLSRQRLVQSIHPDDRDRFLSWLRQQELKVASEGYVEVRLNSPGETCTAQFCVYRLDESNAMLVKRSAPICEKHASWVTEERLRFEQLLTDLSSRFVNQPVQEIASLIDDSLRLLVEFLGNDRSTLFTFGDDDTQVSVIHTYTIANCVPFPLGSFAANRLPWYIEQLRSGKTVFVIDIDNDLPSEARIERQHCLDEGIRSNVSLPLQVGGQVLGGLTFAFLRERCNWPHDVLARLQLLADVFAHALMRQRADAELQKTLEENRLLREQLEQENVYLRERVSLKHQHGKVIGHSDAINRVLAAAERVAETDAPVLLLGETGTGKELLSQTIHDLSTRKSRAMIVVNCASLPATLIESELFGREAGAYTGAASAQVGHFQLADGSTLFLDEVGELPIELQAKLLRVLEDGTFHRLGSPKTMRVDVRIIAATNRNLKEMIRQGKFREDLYHRLNVFPIQLPPLRERPEDIPLLVWAFTETLSRRMGKTIKRISRKTMHQLQQYAWPGNVRELSNAIERAIILANDDSLQVTLPDTVSESLIVSREAEPTLIEAQRDQIQRVLMQTGWRIRGAHGAAEILKIKPTTLEARMVKLGIKRPRLDEASH